MKHTDFIDILFLHLLQSFHPCADLSLCHIHSKIPLSSKKSNYVFISIQINYQSKQNHIRFLKTYLALSFMFWQTQWDDFVFGSLFLVSSYFCWTKKVFITCPYYTCLFFFFLRALVTFPTIKLFSSFFNSVSDCKQ